MITIRLQRLGRSFGTRHVLRDLDLEVSPGDRLVVRGSNGSGKSTLLRILAGLLSPTRGTAEFLRGEAALDDDERRAVTGYLAPDLVLYDELTALENLDFFAGVRGLPGGDASRALLDRVGLGDRVDDPVGTFSTGLRQRAKFAFALQNDPAVLLLDEPSSNLDDAGRAVVAAAVESVHQRGGIVILASNDPAEFAYGTRDLALA